MDARRFAPATLRNRDPIGAVLADELPEQGTLLEVAAGTGEHAAYLAPRFPGLAWQPTDPDEDALASIAAWRDATAASRLLAPLKLDAASADWPFTSADAMLCVNMIHISPPGATVGLMAGAGRLLPVGGPLIVYGPFLEPEVVTAPSNLEFDASLKARNPEWGLRNMDWVDALAAANGLQRTRRVQMPANNLTLVYRKL
ncbi:MAG: DUF938 domain-containing protein [Erythrobacter sp.]|nr:MAG: DUF938 domain-containing protein [Erythrobacter sp.]